MLKYEDPREDGRLDGKLLKAMLEDEWWDSPVDVKLRDRAGSFSIIISTSDLTEAMDVYVKGGVYLRKWGRNTKRAERERLAAEKELMALSPSVRAAAAAPVVVERDELGAPRFPGNRASSEDMLAYVTALREYRKLHPKPVSEEMRRMNEKQRERQAAREKEAK